MVLGRDESVQGDAAECELTCCNWATLIRYIAGDRGDVEDHAPAKTIRPGIWIITETNVAGTGPAVVLFEGD